MAGGAAFLANRDLELVAVGRVGELNVDHPLPLEVYGWIENQFILQRRRWLKTGGPWPGVTRESCRRLAPAIDQPYVERVFAPSNRLDDANRPPDPKR